eukprot:EG_transcript_3169
MAAALGDGATEPPPPLIAQFLAPGFEPSHYLRTVLRQEPPFDLQKEELADGLQYVKRQLQREVALHHDELMGQVSLLKQMDQSLEGTRTGVASLQNSLKRLRHTVKEPHDTACSRVVQLRNMWTATELLRRLQRFTAVLAKLREQDAQAKLTAPGGPSAMALDLPKAAKNLREVEALLEETDLHGVTVVDQEREWLATLGKSVRAKAQELLRGGLETLSQAEVGVALQTAFNLEALPQTVKDTLERQKKELRAVIFRELDHTAISKAIAAAPADKEEASSDPKALELSRTRSVVFGKLDAVTAVVHQQLGQAAQLYRVLAKKRDPLTHVVFLDVVADTIGPNFLEEVWACAAQLFKERLAEAIKRGAIHQMLVGEYPRLYRLMLNFTAGLVDLCYWVTPATAGGPTDPRVWGKEAIATYEKLFHAASQHRLYEKVELLAHKMQQGCPDPELAAQTSQTAEKDRQGIGVRTADVRAFSAAITHELTSTRGERALQAVVLTNIAKALQLLCVKCEGLWLRAGPASQTANNATNAQVFNASMYNALMKVSADVVAVVGTQAGAGAGAAGGSGRPDEHAEAMAAALQTLREQLADLEAEALGCLKPIAASATKSLEKLVVKLHAEDFDHPDLNKTSAYVTEVETRLQALRHKVLYLFDATTPPYIAICQQLAGRVLSYFVRHAALHRPMSEQGKMKLSTDIAQLQFAVGALCSAENLGAAFRELRAFRSLLFMDTAQVPRALEVRNALVHPLNVLHHLFARATHPARLPLPYVGEGKTLEAYSEELDVLADPALEGTPQQYDCYYHIWQSMASAAAAYETCTEVDTEHRTQLAGAILAVGELFWPS